MCNANYVRLLMLKIATFHILYHITYHHGSGVMDKIMVKCHRPTAWSRGSSVNFCWKPVEHP